MSMHHRQTKGQDSSSVHYAQVDEWGSWPSLATFQPLNPITTFVHLFSPPPSWSGVDRKRSSEDPGWQDRVVDALFAAASSWVEFVLLAAASELCRRLLRSHSRQSSESRLTTMLWGWIGRCDAFSLRRTFFVDPRILSLFLPSASLSISSTVTSALMRVLLVSLSIDEEANFSVRRLLNILNIWHPSARLHSPVPYHISMLFLRL